MQVRSLSEMPTGISARFFRVSPVRYCLQLLACLGLLALVGFLRYGDMPNYAAVPLGLLCLYGVFAAIKRLGRSVRTKNWLLAIDFDRMFINFRSFLKFPRRTKGLQIIELQFSDIESVGMVSQYSLNENKGKNYYGRYLEIRLRSPIDEEIVQALFAEYEKMGVKGQAAEFSLMSPCSKCPVFICDSNTLRVDVRDIESRLKEVIDILEEQHIEVAVKRGEHLDKQANVIKSTSKPELLQQQQSSVKKYKLVVCRIIPLVLILAGGINLYSGLRTVHKAGLSLLWPTSEGTIVTSSIETRHSTRRDSQGRQRNITVYHPKIVYEFSVDENLYSGSKVDFVTWRSGDDSRSNAYGVVNRYPKGRAVKVYYAPDNPEESVLEPGPTAGNYLSFLIAYLFFIPGVAIGIFLPKRIYEDRRIWGLESIFVD